MNEKSDPNKYIQEYFKENEWTTLKGQEKKKYAYSKKNFETIKSASKKVESSKFVWFGERQPPKKKIRLSKNQKFKSGDPKTEPPNSIKKEKGEENQDHHSNSKKIAKMLFRSTKNNLKRLENTVSSMGEESTDNEDNYGPRIKRCLRRKIFKTSYKEDDLTSDDEYLYCDDCETDHKGACPLHGPMLRACDREVPKDSEERAIQTLPSFLSIGLSCMPKAGLGVWTEVPLPKGVVFGPYQGHITNNRKEAQNSGYAWQVWKGRKPYHFVEATESNESNWLRFVNCADREDKQNLTAFQYQKQIFYKTYKPVLPYTELLVWYGNNFAVDLGIDIKENTPQLGEIDGYQCVECDALFSTSTALERHKKRHPHMIPDRKYKCDRCSYSTMNSTDIFCHRSIHSNEKNYKCSTCHKGFKLWTTLRRHQRRHTGRKPHACETCKKTFAGVSDLNRHLRTHTGERPFRCQICGSDFKQIIHLRNHERSHNSQRPYKCPQCDYRAPRMACLDTHLVFRHTRNFKYPCPYCPKGFIRVVSLQGHLECKHFNLLSHQELIKYDLMPKIENFRSNSVPKRGLVDPRRSQKYSSVLVDSISIRSEPSGIESLEDLHKHIKMLSIESSIKSESAARNGSSCETLLKKVKVVISHRNSRYLEFTQLPNLNVFGDFRRV